MEPICDSKCLGPQLGSVKGWGILFHPTSGPWSGVTHRRGLPANGCLLGLASSQHGGLGELKQTSYCSSGLQMQVVQHTWRKPSASYSPAQKPLSVTPALLFDLKYPSQIQGASAWTLLLRGDGRSFKEHGTPHYSSTCSNYWCMQMSCCEVAMGKGLYSVNPAISFFSSLNCCYVCRTVQVEHRFWRKMGPGPNPSYNVSVCGIGQINKPV